MAKGNPEVVGYKEQAAITAFNDRGEAERLALLLNNAWDTFHSGE